MSVVNQRAMERNNEQLGENITLGTSKGIGAVRNSTFLRQLTVVVAALALATCTPAKEDEAAEQDQTGEVDSKRGELSKWSYGFNDNFDPEANPQMTKTLRVFFQQANEKPSDGPIEVRVWVNEGGDEDFDYGTAEVTIGEDFEFGGLPAGVTEVSLEPTDGSKGVVFEHIAAEDF